MSSSEGLTRVRLASSGGRRHLAWAEGLAFTLPSHLLGLPELAERISASGDLTLPSGPIGWTGDDSRLTRERAAFTEKPPASARMPFHYHRVPGRLRAMAAGLVGRWQRGRQHAWASFPSWPLDLSVDFIDDARCQTIIREAGPTPVIVSHDIDSGEGLSNLVEHFLVAEEAAGARSTSYVVPCAWPLDAAALAVVAARGHEIGVHGFDHGNHTPFADPLDRIERLDAPRPFIERYSAIGYRAPSLLRTRALLRDLRSRYSYDSSIPTSGGPFPVPNNGCATARPFTIEGISEIPLTLPRDGSLRFLGYSPREIAQLWIDCAETIARSGGIVTLLTHCERRFSGAPAMLGAYRQFLDHVAAAADRFRFVTAAALWRERFGTAHGA